jgi:mono/diheme cytochrome c family protein
MALNKPLLAKISLVLIVAALIAVLANVFYKPVVNTQLTVSFNDRTHVYAREDLLNNPAVVEITVAKDPAYKTAMHYQAVPLSALMEKNSILPGQVIQAAAADGFTVTLPLDLVLRKPGSKGAIPYVAIESPAQPWPKMQGQKISAGPFYVVWLNPEADDIRTEQWPYGIISIKATDSPIKRWPTLAIDNKLPTTSPISAGQALFVSNCLVCHTLNGAGDSDVGPDLNLPKNPTEYFRPGILHAYIRDPGSIRHWKTMWMKGFDKDTLSDREIDQIIAYLSYMADHKVDQKPSQRPRP